MKNSTTLTPAGDSAAFILRLFLSVVLFAHGAQKLLGWFGGYGFHNTMGMFEHAMHIPAFFAGCAIVIEFFGPIFLILGLYTRVAAFFMGLEILVAMFLGGHVHNGFYMNWASNPAAHEGFEFHLLFIGIALALLALGGGRYSVDGARAGAEA